MSDGGSIEYRVEETGGEAGDRKDAEREEIRMAGRGSESTG